MVKEERMLIDNFRTLAEYNHWMNTRMYDCVATMDPLIIEKDLGAFFGSILGTLNHILVADIIWLQRIARHPVNFCSLEVLRSQSPPVALNQILHRELSSLRQQRNQVDNALIALIDELNEATLSSDLLFQDMKGNSYMYELAILLQHLFNHQTHHRGQATTLLHQCGADVGATDLLAMVGEK